MTLGGAQGTVFEAEIQTGAEQAQEKLFNIYTISLSFSSPAFLSLPLSFLHLAGLRTPLIFMD